MVTVAVADNPVIRVINEDNRLALAAGSNTANADISRLGDGFSRQPGVHLRPLLRTEALGTLDMGI